MTKGPHEKDTFAPLTRAVQGGEPRSYPYDSITHPIVQTATYSFANTAELISFMEGNLEREEYGRYGNPSVRALELKVAALEGVEDAAAFSSGMAAITAAILALVKSDAHVVLFADCYRRTRQFVTGFLSRFGVTHTLVPPGDLDTLEKVITDKTRLVISEMPTNPYQTCLDLDRLAAICKKHRAKSLIDSTFATPVNLRPAEHGIDLVVHSATKYLAGHNDVLAGVVAGAAGPVSLVRDLRHVFGQVLDPHAAYLVLRGIKTVGLRVEQQNRSALALARFLEQHPRVKQVWYPGLESDKHHAIAKKYMRGFGGVVTFEIDGDIAATGHFIDALRIPRIAPSLGGVESLVEQPALMSFFELTTAEREAVGIKDSLVRYAVGIEDTQDLVDDVAQALEVL
ncbi:MAG TPA: aminotransferase class I/II-fold pyridoxal phosphate-dependent enzyme [Polyangiales bacterium]|nr:aminotransferase class I/II-fold pyridoxal phosphate-dependent enzyme [Polyangiales bacterium]